jgi:glycosyltransferase involved in cell wall biosynthesis
MKQRHRHRRGTARSMIRSSRQRLIGASPPSVKPSLKRKGRRAASGRIDVVRIRNAEQPLVSVIIPAANERRTIRGVIREASRVHPSSEVIVVANGSTDGTLEIASHCGARVVSYSHSLGHDVGRAIGAKMARGQVLLFTDADFVISGKELKPFVSAVLKGADIALNRYQGPTGKSKVHSVILSKHALNIAVARPDLSGSSMTAIPHAISRRALEAVGADTLTVPPLALAKAILYGLNVRAVEYVDVGRRNRRRRQRQRSNPLEALIVGDHLEAMNWVIEQTNERAGMTDNNRDRKRVRIE